MAYYNNTDDASFYPTSPAFGELDAYPSLNQTSATNIEAPHTLTNDWNVGGQPDYMVGSLTSLGAEPSFDPVSSVALHAPQTNGYDQPSYPEDYWPVNGQYAESYRSGVANRDDPFFNTGALEYPTVVPTPGSAPLDYWGDSESGPSTSTFYTNVQTPHQPSTGLTRTGLAPAWRFDPYGIPSVRPNEHRNAEAGPSTLVPPPAPYPALPTTNPSGGISEAAADAANNQTTTEEDTAPATRRPRGTGQVRDWRVRSQRDARTLRAWAQGWKNLPKTPSHEKALEFALEALATIRVPVYAGPRLLKGAGKRTAQGKKGADSEHKRRKGTRELNQELSRYYPLPAKKVAWGCPELLLKVLDDVEGLPKPPPP